LRLVVATASKARPGVTVHSALEYGQPIGVLLDESTTARMLVLGVIRDGIRVASALPVVVGVDGSPLSEAALGIAFDEASTRRVGLVAVHAWSEIAEQGVITLTDTPQDLHRHESDEERLLAARLAGWQEKYPDVSVERMVTRQRPQAVLLEYAGAAQLVVVGSHGRGGVTGLLLGSTSQALLHHAPCPVIVAKPTRS
jgi:nucleotide-binding universal stress UspA family protein